MEHKLISSIQSNSYKIVELYNKIEAGSLITGPIFQRNLVWKKQHKYAFIQTILLNYPFPEVYIASQQLDVDSLKAIEIVVDGQQRLTTIVEYVKGGGDFAQQTKVKPFNTLSIEEKKEFLNYPVSVKDLKDLQQDTIIQIFKRINSTNYALNDNEVLNAEYGGGEFAYFAKQLVDGEYVVDENSTDIVVPLEERKSVVSFFTDNKVFSDNDIKRMFDSQYIMLLSATILEGAYFGRSTKIETYLERYNSEFSNYKLVLAKILNAIKIIRRLSLSPKSYWFNKANLFTLIIELQNVKEDDLDLNLLETKLLELEKKVDLYFNADDEEGIRHITEDERRYFEVARQGSHEIAAREHRGKVISKIISESLKSSVDAQSQNEVVERSLRSLSKKDFATIIPTETGLKKSIIDAVSGVRELLKENKIHDYDAQDFGPAHKVVLNGKFLKGSTPMDTKVSLYRSNGRGDYRIWFANLNDFAQANDELAITVDNGVITILNLSEYDYSSILGSDQTN